MMGNTATYARVSRVFSATPGRVFDAWLDPDKVAYVERTENAWTKMLNAMGEALQ